MKKPGRPPVALESILQALLFRLREGCSWRTLSILAPHTTYTRGKQWCQSGLWECLLQTLAPSAKGQLWSSDSTCVKVHKQAHGGANTKVPALADTRGRALGLLLSAGHRHDVRNRA